MINVNNKNATVGYLSDITDMAYNKCKYKYTTVGHLSDITDRACTKLNNKISPSTRIIF